MKIWLTTLAISVVFLLNVGNARADPILIGGGTATILNPVIVSDWDALGPRYFFDLQNNSVDLFITSITFSLTTLQTFENLAIAPSSYGSFMAEFPFLGPVSLATYNQIADSMTIYFSPTTSMPEPVSILLFGTGLLFFGKFLRKKRTEKSI